MAIAKFDDRELATMLAALRYWQQMLNRTGKSGALVLPDHFADEKPLTIGQIGVLCERINMAPPARIGITVEGGVLQDVFTDCPALAGLEVYRVDYDTDGADPEDLADVRQSDGSLEPGHVSRTTIDDMTPMREFVEDIDAHLAKEQAAEAKEVGRAPSE